MTALSTNTTSSTKDFSSTQIEATLINFLESLSNQHCSNATIRNYRSDIRQFYKQAQLKELKDIFTKDILKNFVFSQKQKGLKDSSVTRKIASITQFALWSKNQGLISQDVNWLSQVDIESLLKKTNPEPVVSLNSSDKDADLKSNKTIHKRPSLLKFFSPRKPKANPPETLTVEEKSQKEEKDTISNIFSAQTKSEVKKNNQTASNFILPYLNLGLIVLFFVGLGFLGYNQLVTQAPSSLAYPSTPTTASRVLSFQGRLTDTAQNPITTATNMEFKIWDQLSGGTEGTCDGTDDCEYKTSTCSVTPDQDGIFNVGIGDDCGSEIDEAVFTENIALWLEVIVDSETLTPRQPIRTVPFAINSETVQGYPISASESATVNTILVMDSGGFVTLGENSPTLHSDSGTFTISGGIISLSSTGDLLFSDDNATNIPLTVSDTEIDANLGQGIIDAINDIYGLTSGQSYFDQTDNIIYPKEYWTDEFAIGGNSSGSADIKLGLDGTAIFNEQGNDADFRIEGVGATNAFFVQGSDGNVGIKTNSPGADLEINSDAVNSDVLLLKSSDGSRLGRIAETSTGEGYFGIDDADGVVAILFRGDGNDNYIRTGDFGIGDATPDHTLDVAGNIGLDASSYINWGDTDGTSGYGFRDNSGSIEIKNSLGTWVGISGNINDYWQFNDGSLSPSPITADVNFGGTATDSAKVSIAGSFDRGKSALIVNQTEDQDIFTASSSGIPKFVINNDGFIGIGNTSPEGLLDVEGSATGQALTQFNETGDQAVFTASVSGDTKFVIDNSGFVGIGTDTPSYLLDLADDSNSLSLRLINSNADGYGAYLYTHNNDSDKYVLGVDSLAGNLLYVMNNGLVGIGTNTPEHTLDVDGAITGKALVKLNETGDQDIFTASVSGITKFVIDNDGYVGIGTNNPAGNLHVQAPSGNASILLYADDSGNSEDRWSFTAYNGGGGTPSKLSIGAASDVDTLTLYDGNVGVGDTTPNHKLDVAGNIGLDASSYINWGDTDGSAGYGLRDDGGNIQFKHSGGTWATISLGGGGGDGLWAVSSGALTPITATTAVNIGNPATDSAKVSIAGSLDRGLSALIVNQSEDQDIFTASSSGVTKMKIDIDGYVHAPRFIDLANSNYFLDPAATDVSLTTAGKIGAGTDTPAVTLHAEGDVQFGSNDMNEVDVSLYGNLFQMDDTKINTSLSNIKSTFLYDTTLDPDGGAWRKSIVSKSLSWYTEAKDDGFLDSCNPSSDDRCGTSYFPAKANLIVTDDSLYIFDVNTNTMWMKFTQGSGSAIGSASNSDITSVTAKDGRIWIGTRGSASDTGLYEINLKEDVVYYYDTTSREYSNQNIASRGSSNTFSSLDLMTAFAISNTNVNDLDTQYHQGYLYLAAATDSGINLIDLDHEIEYEYRDVASDADGTITSDGYSSTYSPDRAFNFIYDGGTASYTRSNAADSTFSIEYEVSPPNSPLRPQRYMIYIDDVLAANEAPSTWTLESSSTGAWAGEETIIHTVTDFTWVDQGANGSVASFDIPYAGVSRYHWRIHVTDVVNAAADNVTIQGIRFLNKYQKPAVRLLSESVMKSYTPNVSSADNSTTNSQRRINDWRRTNNAGDFRTETGDTTPWLQLDLRQPEVVTQYTVSASNTDNEEPTAWILQASNNGTSWTDLDTQTSQSFDTYQALTYTFSNSTAYKFYRLDVTANNGDTTNAEIGDFMVGTPVITASSSNNDTTQDETNLIFQDQDSSGHYWISATGTGADEWVKYDYGSGNEKVITSYAIRGYQPGQPTRYITDFRLQASNNDSDWTDLDTQTSHSFANDYETVYTFEFSNTTAYRYYRLYVDGVNGGTFATLRGFYLSGAEDRIVTSSVYKDLSQNESLLADDGDLGSWNSLDGDTTGWIEKQFALGQAATVSGVAITSGSTDYYPRDWTIYGSNDRSTWTELADRKGIKSSASGETQTFIFGNDTAYQFYRFKINATLDATRTALQELKFLGAQYNNVRFADSTIVGTNATNSQLGFFHNIWDRTDSRDLDFTTSTGTDVALTTNPSGTIGNNNGWLQISKLTGAITNTKYALEADGGEVFYGHSNGLDKVISAPTTDPDNTEAKARVDASYSTSRIIANKYDLDHYWPMEEPEGATQITDYGTAGGSSNTFNYKVANTSPTSTPSGKIGRGYAFDKSLNQYITIEDEQIEDIDSFGQSQYALGGWVYYPQDAVTNGNKAIMGDYVVSTNAYGFALWIDDESGAPVYSTYNGSGTNTSSYSPVSLPTDQWVHLVVQVKSDSKVYFYYNGELIDNSNTVGGSYDGGDFTIGDNGTKADPFTGRLDELFIKYGTTLSDDQLEEMYQDGLRDRGVYSSGTWTGETQISDGDSPRAIMMTDATEYSSSTIGYNTLNLVPNAYQGRVVEITGGTGTGQSRIITKNDNDTFTVSPNWSTTPDSTSDFEVTPYALPGSTDEVKAVRADQNNLFIGLNDGADGGGVVRLDRESDSVIDYYHGDAAKTDDHSGSWDSTTGYDDIVGIESTQDNLLITSEEQYWREKIGDSLWEAIDKLQQGFSAGVVDNYTQSYDGSNIRNNTKTVMRKGWSWIDNDDTNRTVYYGISYDQVPLVFISPAGATNLLNNTNPTSLESCVYANASGDDLVSNRITRESFNVTEVANTAQACFTWLSLGDYSGSTTEGSFGQGADLAEWYGTDDETLTAGEIVSIAPSGDIKVTRSDKPQDSTSIGIIATQPSIVLGPESGLTPGYSNDPQLTKGAKTAVQVALAGRVPVKVSLENGVINPGDYLTTGSKPGVAVKAITAGPVIGQAMEKFDGSSTVVAVTVEDETLGTDTTSLQSYVDNMADAGKDASTSAELTASASASLDSTDVKNVEILDEDLVNLKNGYGTIMAFVNTGYGDPEAGFSYDEESGETNLDEGLAQLIPDFAKKIIEEIKTTAKDSQIYITERMQVFTRLFAREVMTQELKTDLISPINPEGDITFQLGETTVSTESGIVNIPKLEITNASGSTVTSIDNKGNIFTLGDLIAQDISVSTFSAKTASISGKLDTTSARIQKLESKLAQIEDLDAQTAQIVNATISGTLFADDIYDFKNKVSEAIKEPSLLEKLMEATRPNNNPELANSYLDEHDSFISDLNISSSTRLGPEDLTLTDNDIVIEATATFINQYLDVNGSAYIAKNLGLGQSLVVSDSMFITAGSIDYSPVEIDSPTLNIQPSGKGSLSLMAGLFTLDETGTAQINGDLTVTGDLTVQETLLTNMISTNDFTNPLQVQIATKSGDILGEVQESRFEILNELGIPVATISAQGKADFSSGIGIGRETNQATNSGQIETNKTSGTATIGTGHSDIVIKSPVVSEESLIYITPLGSTDNKVLYVKELTNDNLDTPEIESGFKVGFDTDSTRNVKFNWWIVN